MEPASPTMSVYLTTFNTNMRAAKLSDDELARWIAPAFKGEEREDERGHGAQPDLIAIGVQELLPLELALAGWAQSTLAALAGRIHIAIDSASPGASYTLLSTSLAGGVALVVLAKESIAAAPGRISRPVTASLALGDGGLSNKAATGVRFAVDRSEGGETAWESFTFISTHLSAHDYNLPRRNAEFASIASSLLFPASSPLTLPHTIYDSSHVFLMGDLNYRLLRTPPQGHALSVARLQADDQTSETLRDERDALLGLDTLKQEQARGKAFLGLREGDLRRFAPTYKRVIGQRQGFSPKRIPGYTDRILFASCSGEAAEVRAYESIEEITLSDHKPVTCRVVLPRAAPSSGRTSSPLNTPVLALDLDVPLPARTDPSLLLAYKTWGLAADRTVGYAWLLTLLLGGGKLKIGLAVEAILLLGIAGYASGLLRW